VDVQACLGAGRSALQPGESKVRFVATGEDSSGVVAEPKTVGSGGAGRGEEFQKLALKKLSRQPSLTSNDPCFLFSYSYAAGTPVLTTPFCAPVVEDGIKHRRSHAGSP